MDLTEFFIQEAQAWYTPRNTVRMIEVTEPSDDDLEKIRVWDYLDIGGLLKFVRERWHLADWGWNEIEPGVLTMSTGGWSGNEDLIQALRRNEMFWAMCWLESRRGGHYKFFYDADVRHIKIPDPPIKEQDPAKR